MKTYLNGICAHGSGFRASDGHLAALGPGAPSVRCLVVSEHAYRVTDQNRRPERIAALYNVTGRADVAWRDAAARG